MASRPGVRFSGRPQAPPARATRQTQLLGTRGGGCFATKLPVWENLELVGAVVPQLGGRRDDGDVYPYDLAGQAGDGGRVRPALGRVGGVEPPPRPRCARAAPPRRRESRHL